MHEATQHDQFDDDRGEVASWLMAAAALAAAGTLAAGVLTSTVNDLATNVESAAHGQSVSAGGLSGGGTGPSAGGEGTTGGGSQLPTTPDGSGTGGTGGPIGDPSTDGGAPDAGGNTSDEDQSDGPNTTGGTTGDSSDTDDSGDTNPPGDGLPGTSDGTNLGADLPGGGFDFGGAGDGGDPTDPDTTDADTQDSDTTDPDTTDADETTSGMTADQAASVRALQQRIADGDPTAQAALEALLNEVLQDPSQAAEALALILDGAPPELAYAQATGDWSDVPGGDPAQYSDDQVRLLLQSLGISLPSGLEGFLPPGATDLMNSLPEWMLADLFTQGQTHGLQLGAGVGTGGTFLPAGVSAGLALNATTELSNPNVGVGFNQTQSVAITAQFLTETEFTAGRNTLNRVYGVLSALDRIPQPLQDLLSQSPVLNGIVKGVPFSVAYNEFSGTELAYEATITTAQAAQVDAGNMGALPDLYNPGSFETGNSVLIRGGDVEGSTFEAQYYALYGSGTVTDFDGMGFGMTRLENGNFAIYSGPIEAVEGQTFIGVPFAGFTSTDSLSNSQFTYAEIDLSTPEGQAAYQAFVNGGGVPLTDSTGVTTSTTEVLTADAELGFEVGLGPISTEISIRDEQAVRQITTHGDGSQDYNLNYDFGEATLDVTAPMVNGEVDNATTTFVLEDVHPSLAGGLEGAFGNGGVEFDTPQHVQIQLGPQQVDSLIGNADQSLQDRGEQFYDAAINSPGANDLIAQIASAPTRAEAIHRIMVHTRFYGNASTVQALIRLGIVGDSVDGTIDVRPAS